MNHTFVINQASTGADWSLRGFFVLLAAVTVTYTIWRGTPHLIRTLKSAFRPTGSKDNRVHNVLVSLTALTGTLLVVAYLCFPAVVTVAAAWIAAEPRLLAVELAGDAVVLHNEWPGSTLVVPYADVRRVTLYDLRGRYGRTGLRAVITTRHGNLNVASFDNADEVEKLDAALRSRIQFPGPASW